MVDINAERLAFAKSYVATDTFLPPAPLAGEKRPDHSQRSAELLLSSLGLSDTGLDGIDLVIEASGAESCVQMGLHALKANGRFIQVGMGAPDIVIPAFLIVTKELVFKGSFRYGPGVYDLAISLVSQGKIDLKPLLTHRYSFEDAVNAFEHTKAGKGADGRGVIKAMIAGPNKVTV